MRRLTLAALTALCVFVPTAVFAANAEMLLQKVLPESPDQEVMMLTVAYPPGDASPVHRHNAHTLVYVLEGNVVMQVEGGEPVTLGPGETFYESPDDVHSVSRNASSTEAAKILVVFVKRTGAPPTVGVN